MILTVQQLKAIAAGGGGLILDASQFTYSQLTEIVAAAASGNAPIKLRRVSGLTSDQLQGLAGTAPTLVNFDLTSDDVGR